MGRGISPQDTSATRPVAVVNQTLVRKLFAPGENPIGQHFGGGSESVSEWEIVGVVEDTAYTDVRWKNHLMYFVPLGQRPLGTKQPIDKDENMYVNAIVLETRPPDEQHGNAGAADARGHQSQSDRPEIPDLRCADC